jgi:hypothetical protein
VSGINLLFFVSSVGGSPIGPSVSNLVYAPTSDNIDTILRIGVLDVTAQIPIDIQGVSFNVDQQVGLRVFGRPALGTRAVARYTYAPNIEDATWSASVNLIVYSNMEGLWTGGTDLGDNNYIGFLLSPNSRLGQVTNTGTNLASVSLITTAGSTNDVINVAVPISTAIFIIQNNGVIAQYSTSNFSVSTASFVSSWATPYSVGNSRDGISFSQSGNKLYVMTQLGSPSFANVVYEHALSTPYTLSTVNTTATRSTVGVPTFIGSNFQIRGGYYGIGQSSIDATGFPSQVFQYVLGSKLITNPSFGGLSTVFINGSFLSPDNTMLFLTYRSSGAAGHSISKLSLSPALNITNATLSQQASIPGADGTATAVFFKPDGTRVFFLETPNDEILAFDLSSPWDLSTLSPVSGLNLSSTLSEAQGLWFSTDGTALFVAESFGKSVYQFFLSTAWDVSTAAQVARFFVLSQTTTPAGISFSSSGSSMYVSSQTGRTVIQYNLATPWSIGSASFFESKNIGAVCHNVRQFTLSASESQALVVHRGTYDTPVPALVSLFSL